MTDMKTPDSLRPGDLVGPWRIEGYAGHGSYGAVYRARRAGHPDSMPVALKIAVFPSDPRFSREVALLSRNRHPGIPQLLDWGWWHVGAEVAHPYIAMEWIRGRTLYEWVRMRNPTCRDVLRVLAQVVRTLEVLHSGECLHRDVKGDNILVEPQGRAVLTDFGSGTWKGAPPLTERVMPPNTREYRSPESLRFEWSHWRTTAAHYEAHPADDLYALGVTAYRLVTGVYPPPGTDPEALTEHLQVPLLQRRPAHELNRRVVPELSALIERMLAREPAARGSAQKVAEAAESAAEHARPEARVPFLDWEWLEAEAHAVPEQARGRARSWEWRRVLAAAAMSLAVVGPCWTALESHPEPVEVSQVEVPKTRMAPDTPDAGTQGLGEDVVATRVETPKAPIAVGTVAMPIPPQPLPGQQRPPCKRNWEKIIHGGCWVRVADKKPPCGEATYQWREECYDPAWERTRPPTSTQPQ